ncbi:hypothetical protein FJTKL_04968 [Diaporthe vaccinii]|uniref:Uncharacterized protein n=1 Tax=Diaporthe vaccinii TaxID=105482 RepID=A0ABR4EZ14_9PEZI
MFAEDPRGKVHRLHLDRRSRDFLPCLMNKIPSTLFCLLSFPLPFISSALGSSANSILFIFGSNRTSAATQLRL